MTAMIKNLLIFSFISSSTMCKVFDHIVMDTFAMLDHVLKNLSNMQKGTCSQNDIFKTPSFQ